MSTRFLAVFSVTFVLAALVPAPAPAAPPAPRGDAAFWDDYWQGLMAMRDGKWSDATDAFGRASPRIPADGRPLLASGIARAFAGDFARAHDDLNRARFLKGREPTLWQYAVDAMTNTATGDRGVPIPRSLQKPGEPTATFSGVPGHMVQGGTDYTTGYASAVIYEMAMPIHAAREAGKPTDSPALVAARRTAGQWSANRMLATEEMASRNFTAVRQLVTRADFVEARVLLDLTRSVLPADADTALVSGDLWLKAGRPATARRDYTIAATLDPELFAAYVGRAEAAAMMGDDRTARADLGHAGRDLPAGLKERVEALLARTRVDAEPAALLLEMDKLAADGASVEKLGPLADRLQRAAAARRVRYDEMYQDTIRRLVTAARADKTAVQPRVELAQYLHDEADLRGEEVEPRRGFNPFRWQHSKQAELTRALQYVDEALAIDPKDVAALVTRGHVLTALNRKAEAERSIEAATRLAGPANAEAMRLLAMYRRRQVSSMLTAAGALRSPSFSITTDYDRRSDGVWKTTRTTRYDPSQSDLARAAALEREARALIQEMKRLMESAVEVTRGTLDGLLLQSAYEDWFGAREKALKLLEDAVAAHAKSLKAHDALIDYLRGHGKHEAAIRHEAVAWPLFETTGAPLLRLTWKNVREQGWPAMIDDLEQARKLNPTDVRTSAYLALARREARQAGRDVALLKVAAALERARIDLDDQGIGRKWPRPADDLANAMQVNQDLALALKTAGRPEEALIHYVASGDLALRYPPDGVAALMFGAMRPDPDAPFVPAPVPVNGATLASRAHLGAAKALQAVGRNVEAQKYLEAAARDVRAHDSMVPNVGNGKGDTNFGGFAEGASATALIELAGMDIANKRYQDAFKKLQNASQAKPTQEERRQINDMTKQILPYLNAANRQPPAAQPSVASLLIDVAKEQIRGKNYRLANQSLNRAAQSRPTEAEKREIEALLEQIGREQR